MTMEHTNYRRRDPGLTHATNVAVKRRIDRTGRVLIPAKFRRALTVETGSEVMLVLNEGVLEVRSISNAIRDAQALVRCHVPGDRSLVEELISERNKEAAGD